MFLAIIVFLGAGLIVILLYLFLIMKRHKGRAKQYKTYFAEKEFQEFHVLVDRNLQYVQTFFVFQAFGKFIEIMSVSLSICAFLYPFTAEGRPGGHPNNELCSIILSLIAIVFVIISIYLSPVKRAKQYIIAWRMSDHAVNECLCFVNKKDSEELAGLLAKIPRVLSDIENTLTTDEE